MNCRLVQDQVSCMYKIVSGSFIDHVKMQWLSRRSRYVFVSFCSCIAFAFDAVCRKALPEILLFVLISIL